jgi:hypothetical protein
VLYKLLTASAPNTASCSAATVIPPPSRGKSGIPTDVDFIVLKALRSEPEERYDCGCAWLKMGERSWRTGRFARAGNVIVSRKEVSEALLDADSFCPFRKMVRCR